MLSIIPLTIICALSASCGDIDSDAESSNRTSQVASEVPEDSVLAEIETERLERETERRWMEERFAADAGVSSTSEVAALIESAYLPENHTAIEERLAGNLNVGDVQAECGATLCRIEAA